MLKVWIAGASGQIGRALNDVLDPMEIEALNTDLDELDITDTDEVINFGTVNRPDVIINCTGITDTDECEKKSGTCIPCQCPWRKKLKHCCPQMWFQDRSAFHR